MRVIDTIMLGRVSFAGREIKSEDKDIVFDIIEKMKLEKFAFKDIDRMSGGENRGYLSPGRLRKNRKL